MTWRGRQPRRHRHLVALHGLSQRLNAAAMGLARAAHVQLRLSGRRESRRQTLVGGTLLSDFMVCRNSILPYAVCTSRQIRINPGNFVDGRKTFDVINYDDPRVRALQQRSAAAQ